MFNVILQYETPTTVSFTSTLDSQYCFLPFNTIYYNVFNLYAIQPPHLYLSLLIVINNIQQFEKHLSSVKDVSYAISNYTICIFNENHMQKCFNLVLMYISLLLVKEETPFYLFGVS